jgi:hypothetical protein
VSGHTGRTDDRRHEKQFDFHKFQFVKFIYTGLQHQLFALTYQYGSSFGILQTKLMKI